MFKFIKNLFEDYELVASVPFWFTDTSTARRNHTVYFYIGKRFGLRRVKFDEHFSKLEKTYNIISQLAINTGIIQPFLNNAWYYQNMDKETTKKYLKRLEYQSNAGLNEVFKDDLDNFAKENKNSRLSEHISMPQKDGNIIEFPKMK